MTYANVEQQQIAFVTHSLRPWLVTIEQALQADDDLFGSAATGLYPEFLIDALLRGDAATRAAQYNSYRKQGLSDMEATFRSMESMNFSKRGLSPSMHMVSTMIPFFNAQIQGLMCCTRQRAARCR